MKRLAICVYGNNSIQDLLVETKQKFPEYTPTVFVDTGPDKIKSLWNVSVKKRNYEIQHEFDFDVCIGLYSDSYNQYLNCKIPSVIEDNKIYFTQGHYRSQRTGISLNLILGKSYEFDRAAEFIDDLPFIDPKLTNEDEQFFYHLKSLILETECLNYANSSLFIRAT